MKTPCCEHVVHCDCFKTWITQSYNNSSDFTVRCGYCRAVYLNDEYCYLCLEKNTDHREVIQTMCCHFSHVNLVSPKLIGKLTVDRNLFIGNVKLKRRLNVKNHSDLLLTRIQLNWHDHIDGFAKTVWVFYEELVVHYQLIYLIKFLMLLFRQTVIKVIRTNYKNYKIGQQELLRALAMKLDQLYCWNFWVGKS